MISETKRELKLKFNQAWATLEPVFVVVCSACLKVIAEWSYSIIFLASVQFRVFLITLIKISSSSVSLSIRSWLLRGRYHTFIEMFI